MMGGPKKKLNLKVLGRIFRYMKQYRAHLISALILLLLESAISAVSMIFLQSLIDDYIMPLIGGSSDYSQLLKAIVVLATVYLIGIACSFVYPRLLATMSQGTLKKVRDEMFSHMQTLPVKYFDTHTYGDTMSCYTNDTDTLGQIISQTLPNAVSSVITLLFTLVSMLYMSVWLTLFVLVLTLLLITLTGGIAKKSGKYFMENQKSLADVNGYIEEMIGGQKVVKVFCYEEKSKKRFDEKNGTLLKNARAANTYASVLMPLMNTCGQILYVAVAIVGGALAIYGIKNGVNVNLSLREGMGALTLGSLVSFLTLSKNFMRPITQVSQQVNIIAAALAGAERIFALIDAESEKDDGYVTLVNAERDINGCLKEADKKTGLWAWKHPHEDGTVTYTEQRGDVRFTEVDFGYEEGKDVLHDITLYAEPGQKVAFVGATGAGKTTITNLINRFYDIADGKIRYDGININKIRKPDLRRSLGVVLQDVNLFTGTVMENIRYGKLDATDEECIAAAKLSNADSFIRMLPDGYNTVLSGDGSGLSQGQRQLISIARAAVADPPAMILDEATSSIDTRTEAIVQRGMDALMSGRTVFVIAHRLSTVKNADVIMVLDHGRIIERGTHEKLISERGTYWQLYTGAFELE